MPTVEMLSSVDVTTSKVKFTLKTHSARLKDDLFQNRTLKISMAVTTTKFHRPGYVRTKVYG
jgi:hypothetical protein